MKKIIMMTSEASFHNNYGAVLQGHALFHYLKNLGFAVEIVRYREGEFSLRYHNRITKFAVQMVRSLLGKKKLIPCQEGTPKQREEIRKREKLFMDFQYETMTFYNSEKMNYHQLCRHKPIADFYICGSDQIWNPFFRGRRNDLGYFLKFAPKNKRKIAYAPSFGCDDLPEKAKKDLKPLLSDFYSISVREKSGVEIVKRYTGLEAKLVLDPTMLMPPDYWKSIARMPAQVHKPYILCYRFADSNHTKSMIDTLSTILEIPVISLPLSQVALSDEYTALFDVGPREFIGLIENASLVCTDSFHATVFSILMKTPVCVFLRESFQTGNSMNTRIDSLLDMLSLKDLIITEKDTEERLERCLEIDYCAAHEKLSKLRSESEEYIKNALKEE